MAVFDQAKAAAGADDSKKRKAEAEPDGAPAAKAAAPALTEKEVKKMTVPKLKAALSARGLETTGLKKVLAERLLASL